MTLAELARRIDREADHARLEIGPVAKRIIERRQ